MIGPGTFEYLASIVYECDTAMDWMVFLDENQIEDDPTDLFMRQVICAVLWYMVEKSGRSSMLRFFEDGGSR